MVYRIESFTEVQEEHSTDTSLINIWINIMKEIYKTRASGVALPEPRLLSAQDVIDGEISIDLIVYQSFQEFS